MIFNFYGISDDLCIWFGVCWSLGVATYGPINFTGILHGHFAGSEAITPLLLFGRITTEHEDINSGLILGLRPANEGRPYK